MYGHVLFPKIEMRIAREIAKQGPFQGCIVAEDHRETVQAQDIAGLDLAVGDRVVRAVGVDAGLEPGPGIHQFDEGEGGRDLPDHGVGRCHGDLMLRHAGGHGVGTGRTTDIANPGPFTDQRVLFRRFHCPQPHCRLTDIDQFDIRHLFRQLPLKVQTDMIELDTKPADPRCQAAHRLEEVVLAPVGVGQIVTEGAPPGLPTVNPGGDRRRLVVVHDMAVFASELAIQPARIVGDVVIGGKKAGFDPEFRHLSTQTVQAALHFRFGKRRPLLFAVMPHRRPGLIVRHRHSPPLVPAATMIWRARQKSATLRDTLFVRRDTALPG